MQSKLRLLEQQRSGGPRKRATKLRSESPNAELSMKLGPAVNQTRDGGPKLFFLEATTVAKGRQCKARDEARGG
jgi:hypothetical protein